MWLELWPVLWLSLLGRLVSRAVAVIVFVASGLPCAMFWQRALGMFWQRQLGMFSQGELACSGKAVGHV